jgi:hypothetical protein
MRYLAIQLIVGIPAAEANERFIKSIIKAVAFRAALAFLTASLSPASAAAPKRGADIPRLFAQRPSTSERAINSGWMRARAAGLLRVVDHDPLRSPAGVTVCRAATRWIRPHLPSQSI